MGQNCPGNMVNTLDQATALLDEAIQFLITTGGIYTETNVGLETRLLDCIACNKYIVKRNNQNEIVTAVFYWMVHKEDIPQIENFEAPHDHYHGDTVYIIEMANTTKNIFPILKELRQRHPFNGIFANRRKQFKYHMQQRGGI